MRNQETRVCSDPESLSPAQRFVYEYGSFMVFWGNFDLMMEALIWHLERPDNPIASCRSVNRLSSGNKRARLNSLLLEREAPKAVRALDKLFDVAERNDWVHSVVLKPNGDFSVLTRFRVHTPFRVENKPIDLESSPFEEFYEAYGRFESEVDNALGLSALALGNEYLREVQQPEQP